MRLAMNMLLWSTDVSGSEYDATFAMLKDAGIEIELKGYTTALLYGPPGTGLMASGRYDVALQTWFAGTDPDNSTQLICREVRPKGFNWPAYCNKEMDAAQTEAQKIGAANRSYQVPSNADAPIPPQAPDLSKIKLIDYDFAKYGSSAERKRLLGRWSTEVKAAPK